MKILLIALIFFLIIYFYIWHKNLIKKYKEQGNPANCPYLNGTLNKKQQND